MHRLLRLGFPGIAFLILPLLAFGAPAVPTRGLSYRDLLDLARSGLDATVVAAQVQKLGLDFEPTPRQIAALRKAGLDPRLLEEIVKDSGLSTTSPAHVETVRIFQQRQPDGRVLLVLTNLDDQGNPIRDPAEPPEPERPRPPAEEPVRGCAPAEAPREEAPAQPPPMVVVNVQAPPAPPTWYSMPVAVGGIVGAYRYPEHLGFLGYGQGISSPGWFSGLGLNASNNFGHRPQDKPNTTGLGAFFGPPAAPRR